MEFMPCEEKNKQQIIIIPKHYNLRGVFGEQNTVLWEPRNKEMYLVKGS